MSALDRLASNYELLPEILQEYEDLIDETQQLIRDERGVRLARDDDEDGD